MPMAQQIRDRGRLSFDPAGYGSAWQGMARQGKVRLGRGANGTKIAGVSMSVSEGVKHDIEKDRWDLLPTKAVRAVVKVLGFGAKKYGAFNWVKVPEARSRYYAASMRHLVAWWEGERDDPESGLPHLAHALCCIAFLLEVELEVFKK